MSLPLIADADPEPEASSGTDLLVIGRSSTLRQFFVAAARSRGMTCREARDAFDAVAMFAIGISLRQVVFLGTHAVTDARAMLRRLAALGIPGVPLLAVTDAELKDDIATVPVESLDQVLGAIQTQLPPAELMVPSRDDEECERQMDARKELNKAQALLLDVVDRVDKQDLPGPMMPQLLAQLRQKLQNPNLSLYDLAEFVKPHQALSARVMALANSAHYARGVPIASLRNALPRIGLERAGALLQAVATLEYEVGSDARTRASLRRLLKESYLTALFAEQLAEACLHPDPPKVYTTALFHNIGSTFLVYTYALLFEKGTVKAIAPGALQQIAVEGRDQLNGLLIRALDLPEGIQRLADAATAPNNAAERLVMQAAWIAETALDGGMAPIALDMDAVLLGLDAAAIDVTNRALPEIASSMSLFR